MTDTAVEVVTFQLEKAGMLNTRVGLEVLAEGLKGERILFTKLAIGDGVLDAPTEADYRAAVLNMDSMINWRMDLPIVEKLNRGNGEFYLHAIKPNAEVPESFFAKEQAVFCIDPRTGEEILYAYRNSGLASDFIPSNTGAITKIIDLAIVTVIQNAANVDAILDASFAYVALSRFTEHVDSEHPHLNTPNHYLNVSDTKGFWAIDEDTHLHIINVDNAREVILGDAAALIPSLGKTISDNKNKIDELNIFTQAKNELGLDANLLIVEDFNPASEIDDFKVKVLSCARGGRLIGVANDSGILKGAYYWIADGVNQELIQVKGVSYSTDYYHVSLAQGLTYEYNLDRCYMYRSTITSKIATVDSKSFTWAGGSFKGIEANVERILTLDTSQENYSALKIEGEGIVTTDGYFTLTQSNGILVN